MKIKLITIFALLCFPRFVFAEDYAAIDHRSACYYLSFAKLSVALLTTGGVNSHKSVDQMDAPIMQAILEMYHHEEFSSIGINTLREFHDHVYPVKNMILIGKIKVDFNNYESYRNKVFTECMRSPIKPTSNINYHIYETIKVDEGEIFDIHPNKR